MNAFKIGFWVALTIAVIAALVSLITLNQDTMTLSIFSYTSPEQPKWMVLVSATAFGAIFSLLFFLVQLIVLETRNIRLRRANRQLERALAQYNPQLSSQYAQNSARAGGPAVTTSSSGPGVSLDPALDDEV